MKLKLFCLILVIFGLAGCDFSSKFRLFGHFPFQPETTKSAAGSTESAANVPAKRAEPIDQPGKEQPSAADIFVLSVAFASQAPYANWDELHDEACEEASMIMAEKYFKAEELNAHVMEQGILNLVKWEEENGYKVDVTAAETVEILKNYFEISAVLDEDVTADNIKKNIAAGNLVIIPAAGRLLGNPNFSGSGPIYHMLVIKGYDDRSSEFITNDPGTRKGEGYRYEYQTLINAIHNWNHELAADGMSDEDMVQGRKVLIIVNK